MVGGVIVEFFEDFEEGGQVMVGDFLLCIDDVDVCDVLVWV